MSRPIATLDMTIPDHPRLVVEVSSEQQAAIQAALDALHGAGDGAVVEAYPTYYKGPCVLVLQKDSEGKPIHVMWGIPSQADYPAVVVTAYRPDPSRWADDFLRRKS